MNMRLIFAAIVAVSIPAAASLADGTMDSNCAAITQAAADGASARIQANDQAFTAPKPVQSLSCLNSIFSTGGLNLIPNFFNPDTLLTNIENQMCNAANSEWQDIIGSVKQCGLSVNGINLGLSGLSGSGFLCPKLTLGGNGSPLGSIDAGLSGSAGMLATSQSTVPTGYPTVTYGGVY